MLSSILLQPCTSRFAASFSAGLYPIVSSSRSFTSSNPKHDVKGTLPPVEAAETIQLTSPVTYISESTDPWFNLSYEDWLLRNTPQTQPVLFLYRNRPCVVIGRNQNPWKETTPRWLRETSIPLIRRRSGGGTVYHDMGNTNFSIILPRLLFTRSHGANLIARAIRDHLGLSSCTINDRNDVIIRDDNLEKDFKMSDYVSGSAYKIIQNKAYHHGTMLISSSLAELGKSLKSSSPNLITKGIPSHPSPVTTLNTYLPTPTTHEAFVQAATTEFASVYASNHSSEMDVKIVREEDVQIDKVWEGVKELKSWEWQYGQTPEFSNLLEGELSFGQLSAFLTSRHALLTSLTFQLSPSSPSHDDDATEKLMETRRYLDTLALGLVGKRYESLEGSEGFLQRDEGMRGVGEEVLQWLRGVM